MPLSVPIGLHPVSSTLLILIPIQPAIPTKLRGEILRLARKILMVSIAKSRRERISVFLLGRLLYASFLIFRVTQGLPWRTSSAPRIRGNRVFRTSDQTRYVFHPRLFAASTFSMMSSKKRIASGLMRVSSLNMFVDRRLRLARLHEMTGGNDASIDAAVDAGLSRIIHDPPVAFIGIGKARDGHACGNRFFNQLAAAGERRAEIRIRHGAPGSAADRESDWRRLRIPQDPTCRSRPWQAISCRAALGRGVEFFPEARRDPGTPGGFPSSHCRCGSTPGPDQRPLVEFRKCHVSWIAVCIGRYGSVTRERGALVT